VTYSDPDVGEVFTVTLPNAESWITQVGDTFTFTPTIAEFGLNTVVIRVSDSNVLVKVNGVQSTDLTIIINVSDENAVPVILAHNCENS